MLGDTCILDKKLKKNDNTTLSTPGDTCILDHPDFSEVEKK